MEADMTIYSARFAREMRRELEPYADEALQLLVALDGWHGADDDHRRRAARDALRLVREAESQSTQLRIAASKIRPSDMERPSDLTRQHVEQSMARLFRDPATTMTQIRGLVAAGRSEKEIVAAVSGTGRRAFVVPYLSDLRDRILWGRGLGDQAADLVREAAQHFAGVREHGKAVAEFSSLCYRASVRDLAVCLAPLAQLEADAGLVRERDMSRTRDRVRAR